MNAISTHATGPPLTARRIIRYAARPRRYDALFGLLGVLVIAEAVSRAGLVNSNFLPPVSRILGVLAERAMDGQVWFDILLTLDGWARGLGLAIVIGVLLGAAAGLSEPVFHAVRPLVEFLRPVPSVALIPLAILAFGAGIESKVFLAAFAATWPILIQTMYGVRELDPVQVEVAKSYRVNRADMVLKVLLPSAVPFIATGIRIASSIALALAVSAELIIGIPGLGQAMAIARASGAVELTYALLIAAGLLGWGLNLLFATIERRTLAWHPTHRKVTR